MSDDNKALTRLRIHEIKAMFHAGRTQQEVVEEFVHRWPISPRALDQLIAIAGDEISQSREADEHENREFVMNELKAVYYRACASNETQRPDLGAQVSALTQIGKFCGLSEKNPYRGKLLDPEKFTDEEYRRVLQS